MARLRVPTMIIIIEKEYIQQQQQWQRAQGLRSPKRQRRLNKSNQELSLLDSDPDIVGAVKSTFCFCYNVYVCVIV